MDKGIKKNGREHLLKFQRARWSRFWATCRCFSRSARIVPEMRDGKAAGFRLYAVKPDGPLRQVGMQNGDVISSINGLEITSPEKSPRSLRQAQVGQPSVLGMETNGRKSQRTTQSDETKSQKHRHCAGA